RIQRIQESPNPTSQTGHGGTLFLGCTLGRRGGILDFEARHPYVPRALAKEPKRRPPTGPGGRRQPPDSAMRPRALLVLGTESGTWNEMFDSLSERLGAILDRLTRRGALTEADVDAALREVRRALLEADVALDVARAFIDQVKSHAVGVEGIKS